MATTEDRLVIRHLEAARGRLLARGDAEAVSSLDAIIGRLEDAETGAAGEPDLPPTSPASELLTAQEAAEILGVTSVSPVWRWVKQGKLTFRTDGGQHRITRDSVERLLMDPVLEEEHAYAAELAGVLAPFDATEEDLAEMFDWYEGPAKLDADD
jgi:excisionase family DNA binding protein